MLKIIFIGIFACSNVFGLPLHLDLEASSRELVQALEVDLQNNGPRPLSKESQRLQEIVKVGKRNLDWLKEINSHLKVPISLYEKGTNGGIPIETPKSYSRRSILADFSDLRETLPQEMKSVLFSNMELPSTHPFEVDVYREWAKKVDRNYQYATRWILLEPYLDQLAAEKKQDIRGYYFLNLVQDLESELKNFSDLKPERKNELKDWILKLCFLDLQWDEAECLKEFNKSTGKLNEMVSSFWRNGEKVYRDFFDIPAYVGKTNLELGDSGHMLMNFKLNPLEEINDFLKVNLEEEWQAKGLKLEVLFDDSRLTQIEVRWTPGVTPHVNGLGGRRITMDANSSLDDWDTKWTIRHELGHVVGLPDCYLEFYDPSNDEIIGYQIDVNDLMCSRNGKMNDRIWTEVKRHYDGN